MKRIRWADTAQTRGFTSVTFLAESVDDLHWFKRMQPAGCLVPRFSEPRHALRSHADVVRYMTWVTEHRVPPLEGRYFAYEFPEDDAGRALLVALRLRSAATGTLFTRGQLS